MNVELIKYLSQFHPLASSDQTVINSYFKGYQFKAGDWLLKAGEVTNKLFFIQEGILKITVPHPTEKDLVYYFMEPGQFMSFLYSMYGRVPAQQGLQAASVTSALAINYSDLQKLFEQLPYVRALIDEIAQLSMAKMVTVKNAYLVGDAKAKYELFLKDQPEVAKQVALADIASYLNITPQSLSRIRKMMVSR
ncbi:Crp/Fnr family transcriptional regulator [Mucilaginibacter koreensis]